MGELSTIQKRNKLNKVYRLGDKGPGDAYHAYHISGASDGRILFGETIFFQKGPRKDPAAQHGVLDSDLLEIVRDRLKSFQAGPYACRENALALTHVEEALLWMNARAEDRAERSVLGTYEK
jgi:hypothetical protein